MVQYMQFEGYRRSSHIPNLTPLIDIVFLLLIFFMLTSHFVNQESLNIELPKAETGEALGENNRLEIIINADGKIDYKHDSYKNDAMSLKVLEDRLRQDLSTSSEKSVRIKGDQSIAFSQAVEILDLARKAGASGVDIVTEQK
jgi:biopolymer transport protein ExbD